MTYMKFTFFLHPSLVIITVYLVCLINAWESRENIFKRNHAFSLYNHAIAQEPLPREVMKFTILVDPSYIFGLSDLRLGVEKKVL